MKQKKMLWEVIKDKINKQLAKEDYSTFISKAKQTPAYQEFIRTLGKKAYRKTK